MSRRHFTDNPSTEEIAKHDPYRGGEKEINGNPVDITDNLRERQGQVGGGGWGGRKDRKTEKRTMGWGIRSEKGMGGRDRG
eukprot:1356344-Amorphochlora_amoeboformis.AAC.1